MGTVQWITYIFIELEVLYHNMQSLSLIYCNSTLHHCRELVHIIGLTVKLCGYEPLLWAVSCSD